MNNVNNESDQSFDIEIGRNWPQQIIVDHAPYWRAWRKQTRNCTDRSEQLYEKIGRLWIAFANGKNIGPKLMLEWMARISSIRNPKSIDGISKVRISKYRSRTAAYLKWLRLMGAIQIDPGDCMPKVRNEPPAPKQVYTHAEYLKMVAYAEENPAFMMHQWLAILGYHTGLSLVDCCNLRWDQVELPDDGPCFVRKIRTKLVRRYGSRATATIPILVGSELWVWFKRLQRKRQLNIEPAQEDHITFVHEEAADTLAWSFKGPSEEMARFIRAALGRDGSKDRTFRHFRNTFASRLINAGIDSVLVAKMTGHLSVNQLVTYVVPDQAAMQQAILKGLRSVEAATILPEKKDESACS